MDKNYLREFNDYLYDKHPWLWTFCAIFLSILGIVLIIFIGVFISFLFFILTQNIGLSMIMSVSVMILIPLAVSLFRAHRKFKKDYYK